MFTIENPFLWLLGIPAIGLIWFLVRDRFNAAKRQQHRRGQSHRPVTSQDQASTTRPTVHAEKSTADRKP